MKKALFYTFLLVFFLTACVTLLGIIKILTIDEKYLTKIFYALVVESIIAVFALFKKTDFFSDDKLSAKGKINIYILPRESFGRAGDPHTGSISIYSQSSDKARETSIKLIRVNGHLCAYLDDIDEEELIKVKVVNSKGEAWEAEYFPANVVKAEMDRI